MIVYIRLREELQRREISAYRLVQAVQGRITPKAIYALASGKAKRIDLETLGVVATALERASEQPVTAADLLEFQSEPVEPEIQPFQWNQAKQYTDPEAEDFTLVLQALRDRDRQIEAARFPP
jgi:DNA-binding Xre family transcriptional regulator